MNIDSQLIAKYLVTVLMLGMLLAACASDPVIEKPDALQSRPENVEPAMVSRPVTITQPAPVICLPDVDPRVEAAKRELAIANRWFDEKAYQQAYDTYERALSHRVHPLVHAYALTGMIMLRLERESQYYDRPAARVALDVLRQRVQDSVGTEYASEARLLQFVAESVYFADLGKDQLVLKNRQLQSELEQRDEAIKRLRDLTVGN